jgi:transposase
MNIRLPSPEEIREAFKQGEDEIMALFDALRDPLLEIAEQLKKQAEAIRELEAKASKNSRNSSKPPSSDGYGKINRTESLRSKGDKSNGGQPGHKGSTLEAVEVPDKVEIHDPVYCEHCQAPLEAVDVSAVASRQVFDIPAMKIIVTAHEATIKICPVCDQPTSGDFPESVTQPVQYGDGVKSLATYFNHEHFVPVKRTAQIFKDVFGQAPSEGFILKASEQLETAIEPARQVVKQQLQDTQLLHVDETGLRVKGKLHWLHSASTDTLTDYTVHPKRGQEALEAGGILNYFRGRLVHDHWKPYFSYGACQHIACNAHHIRELIYIEKQYRQSWAGELLDLLLDIKHAIEEARPEQTQLSIQQQSLFERRYDALVKTGLIQNPFTPAERHKGTIKKRGRPKQTPAHNLLVRFRDFKASTLAFMYDFSIPFDNNLAERDIRMVKVKQKVSGGFRTLEGAQRFASIRGYVSTARKNSVSILGAIQAAFSGSPFIPATQS